MTVDTNADQGAFTWVMEDGRIGHTMRQSELGNYIGMCSEQIRLDRAKPELRRENDAMASGTAVHAGIQHAIDYMMAGGMLTIADIHGVALDEFARIVALPNFSWVSNTPEACIANIKQALDLFHDHVLPGLHPMGTEIPFRRLVLYEDDQRVIYANGTLDYHDKFRGLFDWKTASSAHRAWEKQRWNIQSIMYPWAMKQIGEIPPDAPDDFTFIIFVNGKKAIQTIKVTRTAQHIEWMRRQALQMALQVEANLATWNLNDNGWWCSKKWCSHFSTCKGQFVNFD